MLEALVLHYKNTLNGKLLPAIMWPHQSLACIGPSGLCMCTAAARKNETAIVTPDLR